MSLHLHTLLLSLRLQQVEMGRKKKKRNKQLSLDDIGSVCSLCFKELELHSSTCVHEKV